MAKNEDIENCRKEEREYIKAKFDEFKDKYILIEDKWSGQQFKILIEKVEEIDLSFPRQCLVTIRWLHGKEEQCLGSSFYRVPRTKSGLLDLKKDHPEILELITKEIVLTGETNTERKINNYDEDNLYERGLNEKIVKEGLRLPPLRRHYDVIGAYNT